MRHLFLLRQTSPVTCLNRTVTNIQVPGAHSSGWLPATQKCPLGQMPPVESLFGLGILAPRRQ